MNSNIRSIIVEQCLEILKREDVKSEIKSVIKPMISLLLQEIYPYIFISLIFVLIRNIHFLTAYKKINF